ncbi:MAG: DUF1588 domain-containing protein [Amphiplicatus sp.]
MDFSKVEAIDKENPGCAACHRASDPIGFILEHFDRLGQRRKMENGSLIDVSNSPTDLPQPMRVA